MKLPWHIEDIIDLEYFLQKDEAKDEAVISRRDRDTFLKQVVPSLAAGEPSGEQDRRNAVRLWLNERRQLEAARSGKEDGSPGTVFRDILSLISAVLLIAGLFVGMGLAFAVLQYQGREPINVSTYLGVFVLLQILLITLLLFWRLVRHFVGSLKHLSVLQSIFGPMLAGLFEHLVNRALGRLPAENRNHLVATAGVIRGHHRIYGSALYWRTFILSQIFGIGFNLGVLGGSVTKIMGSDLAFGWQSTLQVSSQAVHQFVKTLAVPWSLFSSLSAAHPTLEQIQGSRMVLKDGIYSLATPDLVSWWPFLILAVCCYGLLPRIILFAGGIVAQKRALATLKLNHANCVRLWRRMTTPYVETEGRRAFTGDAPQSDSKTGSNLPTDRYPSAETEQPAYLLISEDISRNLSAETLTPSLERIQGAIPMQHIAVSLDFEADREILVEGIASGDDKARSAVAFLQEAWQPPIAEVLSYVGDLRKLLGTESRIHIVLLGKTLSDSGLLPVARGDMQMWGQAVAAMGDPYIQVDALERAL